MRQLVKLGILSIGVVGTALANTPKVPESDSSQAATALALISGVLLVSRIWRKKNC